MSKTNPARGMRDFLPADVRKRNYVIGIIKEVYESYGFEPLETPAVENLETLTGKYGEEGNQLIFKILKRGDKLAQSAGLSPSRDESRTLNELSDLALRYDLTVPLARVVANNKNELPKFFKRYQIQPVWRADRPARGRFREFYQCDVDAIGSESIVVEIEQIAAVIQILRRLGFNDFVVRINHRSLLAGLLNAFGIETHKHADTLVSLDKLDKIGAKRVEEELTTRGIDSSASSKLLSLIDYFNFNQDEVSMSERSKLGLAELVSYLETLKRPEGMFPLDSNVIKKLFLANESAFDESTNSKLILGNVKTIYGLSGLFVNDKTGQIALHELSFIWTKLNTLGFLEHIVIDPSLARGLSYYTGTIMEINVPDLAGSLGGGGRFDGLIGMFGKEQIPACGFSLGLERILVVMDERGMFPPEIAESAPADVMVTIWDEASIADSLNLASELRGHGLRVALYPEPDKLGKQIKYADSIKVPFVCVLGETELAEGKVTVKNMKTGEQQTVERSALAESIKFVRQ